jgi:hypothetical protein
MRPTRSRPTEGIGTGDLKTSATRRVSEKKIAQNAAQPYFVTINAKT